LTIEFLSAHAQRVRTITAQHLGERGALMPVLHDLMDEFGHIGRDDVVAVADVLNLSVAEVHGVVSFYHDFRTTPPPAHTIALCRAEACQAVGAERVFADVVAAHEGDDHVEVREVFCLGNCALGPSGMLDGRLHGRLDAERVGSLTGEWRR
jgi:formate dehydrogenase subunit gamma